MGQKDTYDEALIVEQLHHQETVNAAFGKVIEHYSQPLYWQIRRMVIDHDDANDVLQNTFINKKKVQNNISLDDDSSFLTSNLEADRYFDGDEAQLKLQKAIATLPDKQRLVFNMRYYDEMKYEDMSEILGTSVGALKASYHHAVKKIESFFGEED